MSDREGYIVAGPLNRDDTVYDSDGGMKNGLGVFPEPPRWAIVFAEGNIETEVFPDVHFRSRKIAEDMAAALNHFRSIRIAAKP